MSGSASVDDVGVGFCIIILGGAASGFFCVLDGFLLPPDGGGGDLSLGLTGHDGGFPSLDVLAFVLPLAGLAILDAGSDVGAGCSCGVVAADSAR
jgi:hypothetical protein